MRYSKGAQTASAVKFKSQPTSQAEVRDCALEVTPAELALVEVLHSRVIDFGRVTVGTVVNRSVHVRNGLPHAVQFSLHPAKDSSSELLSGTNPLTQIIPAGAIGLVEVALNCKHSTVTQGREQQLKRTLSYSVNGATGG
eukprot:3530-Heterococcus_DN1.PRE.1